MSENLIERYLTDIGYVRSTRSNVPETSFYPALERLLTDIGKSLSPKVRCVINLANRGAGLPDGGLFSADQFRRKTRDADAKENPFLVQNPVARRDRSQTSVRRCPPGGRDRAGGAILEAVRHGARDQLPRLRPHRQRPDRTTVRSGILHPGRVRERILASDRPSASGSRRSMANGCWSI